jgi:hypothetical protein
VGGAEYIHCDDTIDALASDELKSGLKGTFDIALEWDLQSK